MESSLFLLGSCFSLSHLCWEDQHKSLSSTWLQLQHCHSRKKSNLYGYYLLTWVRVAVQHSSTKDKPMKNFTCGLWSVQTRFHFQNCAMWLVAACVRTQVAGNPNPFPFPFLFPTGTNPQKQTRPTLSYRLDTWCMLSIVLLLTVKW